MDQLLKDFRQLIQGVMPVPTARPFTCSDSPYDCEIFIVGFNSATELGHDFFTRYWDDSTGFKRMQFEADYAAIRRKKGVRPRIEAIVKGAFPVKCLETNIFCVPSKKASELREKDKDPQVFKALVSELKPKIIFAHSDKPIQYLLREAGKEFNIADLEPIQIELEGIQTTLVAWRGPLYLKKIEDAINLGKKLRAYTNAA